MDEIKVSVVTVQGVQKTCALEIKEIIGVDAQINDAYVTFKIKNEKSVLEKLFRFSVLSQSASNIIFTMGEFEFTDFDDFISKIEATLECKEMKYWTEDKPSFLVRCSHIDTELSSVEIEPTVGGIIKDKFDLTVSLNNAEVKFLVFVKDNKAVFGVDMTKNDLSKRQYKLVNSGKSIRAPIAYHLIRSIDFKEGEILLDLNSKTGEIAIESALYLSAMNNYYEARFQASKLRLFKDINTREIFRSIKDNAKERIQELKSKKTIYAYSEQLIDVNSGKSNAKVAGILDLVYFSKVGIDWVDARFEKGEVDKIVTVLPSPSKNVSENEVKKVYKEFFYQVDYILKKTGLAGVLIQKQELFIESIKSNKFNIIKEDYIKIGELEFKFIVIQKQ